MAGTAAPKALVSTCGQNVSQSSPKLIPPRPFLFFQVIVSYFSDAASPTPWYSPIYFEPASILTEQRRNACLWSQAGKKKGSLDLFHTALDFFVQHKKPRGFSQGASILTWSPVKSCHHSLCYLPGENESRCSATGPAVSDTEVSYLQVSCPFSAQLHSI